MFTLFPPFATIVIYPFTLLMSFCPLMQQYEPRSYCYLWFIKLLPWLRVFWKCIADIICRQHLHDKKILAGQRLMVKCHYCHLVVIRSLRLKVFANDNLTMSLWSHNLQSISPGCAAQSITCLATDANLTVDPGVASLITTQSHTFLKIDHEIIPPFCWIIQEGLLSVTSESMCTKY